MKKIFLAIVFVAIAFQGAFAQKINKVVMDPTLHQDVLSGVCSYKGLEHGIFSHWFNKEYKDYHPDTAAIAAITKNINKVSITVVFGSWCGDSKIQVGRFFKILDEAGYHNTVKLIAVKRSLQADGQDITALHIRRIPTFIIYYNGKETGRIVESPRVSLETDLETILKKIK